MGGDEMIGAIYVVKHPWVREFLVLRPIETHYAYRVVPQIVRLP